MTVSAGTPFQVNANAIDAVGIAALDATHSISVYDGSVNATARIIQDDETLGAEFSIGAKGAVGQGSIGVAALSSSKAINIRSSLGGADVQILNISGTTVTAPGAAVGLGGANPTGLSIVALSGSAAIGVYADDNNNRDGVAHYLTVSGNTITDESSVIFESAAGSGIGDITAVINLTATKGMVVYRDEDDSNQLKAVILTITGVTISAGSPTTIDGGDDCDDPALAAISSSQSLLAYRNVTDTIVKAVVLGISGTTVTANTLASISALDGLGTGLSAFSATQFVATYVDNSGTGDGRMIELSVSGTTVSTVGSFVQFDVSAGTVTRGAVFSSSLAIAVYQGTIDAVIITLAAASGDLGLAPMTRPADIDADGDFIYVALLEGGTPILSKFNISLAADGTTVFDPGAGDNIGVQCGRFDADVIWVAGNFGGTNKVEKSADAGDSFTVVDDGSLSDVDAFIVGPDSDDRILVVDDAGEIQETIDSGAIWTVINAATGFLTNTIARLGKNVQEAVFGNDAAANDAIDYSVNSGDDMEDFVTGDFPTDADVTSVIVN